jgi:hypothetical protein
MARFDKYDPVSGGFRARLGFAPSAGEVGDVINVSINGSGEVVKGSATVCDGVICLSSLLNQGDVVDVMTDGEIVDIKTGDNVTGFALGAKAYAGASGAVNVTPPVAGAVGVKIGRFVEAWRLIVRVQDTAAVDA